MLRTAEKESEVKINRLALLALIVGAWSAPSTFAAEGGAHPHHVAVVAGAARHNGKNSFAWGADYSYTFDNDVFLQGFYEQVRGDFNINAYGALVGKKFGHGWQAGIGAGIETKLKDGKNLALVRTMIGYDWHFGNWSFGPGVVYDIIEDESDTVYLGVAFGYGF